MSRSKLGIILGHSHIGCLVNAIAGRPLHGHPEGEALHLAIYEAWAFNGDPAYAVKLASGADAFNPAIIQSVRDLGRPYTHPQFFTLFGGNAHTVLSLIRHQRPYDVVLPEDPDLPLDPEAEIVPTAYIQAILQAQMDRYLHQLYLLRQAVPDRIHAFEPPPPIGDDAFIASRLDPFFTQNSEIRTIAPRLLRRKMWMLQRRLQHRICAANDIALIEAPASAQTPDGFLGPSFYGSDATHGGPRYGEALLAQIEDAMGAKLRSWSTFS